MARINISELRPVGFDLKELDEREMEAIQGGGFKVSVCNPDYLFLRTSPFGYTNILTIPRGYNNPRENTP